MGHAARQQRKMPSAADAGSSDSSVAFSMTGTGHYGRPEVMEWCDENGIDFIFGRKHAVKTAG